MANLLILDASSSLCSVSLITDKQQFHLCEDQPRRHAQRLLPMVDELLKSAGVNRQSLDGIAYGRGPGSFTGIRIAASVMQGISLALDLPVYGVSSLQALAEEVAFPGDKETPELAVGHKIAAIMDAHMGEVFWGFYEVGTGGTIACTKEQVGAPAVCLQELQSFDGLLVGDGLQLPAMQETLLASGYDLSFSAVQPKSEFMSALVTKAWADQQFGNEEQHAPVYLRDSVAWKKLDEQPSLLKR